MLSQLSTVKARLALDPLFVDFDDLLTRALTAISARFDRETNRTLTRTANSTFEFDASETEIIPPCYPIESVSKFETKSTEAEGWVEQSNIDYLIRRATIVSLVSRSRFNTSVTQMVQNIGNTWLAELNNLPDAVEESRTYEPEKRICIESDSQQELSTTVRGVRDQHQDRLQVAGALLPIWI